MPGQKPASIIISMSNRVRALSRWASSSLPWLLSSSSRWSSSALMVETAALIRSSGITK
jgi:hypothetical protein